MHFLFRKVKKYIYNVQCRSPVVYSLPLSCGKVYVAHTGPCVNITLKEHLSSLKGTGGLHLPVYIVDTAAADRQRKNTDCLFWHEDQTTREAFHIAS